MDPSPTSPDTPAAPVAGTATASGPATPAAAPVATTPATEPSTGDGKIPPTAPPVGSGPAGLADEPENPDKGSARTFSKDVVKSYASPSSADKLEGCEDFDPDQHAISAEQFASYAALIRDISDLHDNYRLLVISGGSQRDRLGIAAHLAPKATGIRPRWWIKRGTDARFETIFERVGRASDDPGTQELGFLVITADPSSVENLLPRFSEASEKVRKDGNGYFRCLILTDSKRNFPRKPHENIPHRSIAVSGAAAGSEGQRAYTHAEIFTPAGIQEERPFKEAVRDGIQRTVIRVSVLFGPLPEDRFSEFVVSALGDRSLDFTTGSGRTMTRSSRLAVDVWQELRPTILQECGLRLDTSRGSREIAFASPELALSAEAAAWQDGLAMWELLEALAETKGFVLFREDALDEQREVLGSCIAALGLVAKQLPDIFAKRWLPLLCKQCSRWLEGRMPIVIPPGSDPSLFIPWLSEAFERNRRTRALRYQFCQRVGLVCMSLLSEPESAAIVDRLITRLCDYGASLIAWKLCWNLRQVDAFTYAAHAKICLGRGSTDTFWAFIDDLAWESARSPLVAAANLGMISTWADSAEKEGSIYKRALLGFIPAWLREHFNQRLEASGHPHPGSALPEKDSVQYQALLKSLLDPKFPEVFAERFLDEEIADGASPADLKALAIASCLLWLCSNQPVDPPSIVFEAAEEILRQVGFEVLPLVKNVVLACCEDLSNRLPGLGYTEDDQKAYVRIQAILGSLYKLYSI